MDAVDAAFAATPRADFLPRRLRDDAALDGPLHLGHGSTCSQPRTVEDMLRLLAVEPGMRVLDVGAGSGWTTALLAHLTGPTGSVLGLEIEPDVAAFGGENVRRHGCPWARLELADPEVLGAPDLPGGLVRQLTRGGRMVVPVAGVMTVVTTHGRYRFVPLR